MWWSWLLTSSLASWALSVRLSRESGNARKDQNWITGHLGSDSPWGVMLTMNGKRGRGKTCGVCGGWGGPGISPCPYAQLLSLGSSTGASLGQRDMEKCCQYMPSFVKWGVGALCCAIAHPWCAGALHRGRAGESRAVGRVQGYLWERGWGAWAALGSFPSWQIIYPCFQFVEKLSNCCVLPFLLSWICHFY